MTERQYREHFLRTLDEIYQTHTEGSANAIFHGVTVFFTPSETRLNGLVVNFGPAPVPGGPPTHGESIELDWEAEDADPSLAARRLANGPLRKFFRPFYP